jgi:hypothetical protein
LDKSGHSISALLSIRFSIFPIGDKNDFDYWNVLSSFKKITPDLDALVFVNIENGGNNIVLKTKKPFSG